MDALMIKEIVEGLASGAGFPQPALGQASQRPMSALGSNLVPEPGNTGAMVPEWATRPEGAPLGSTYTDRTGRTVSQGTVTPQERAGGTISRQFVHDTDQTRRSEAARGAQRGEPVATSPDVSPRQRIEKSKPDTSFDPNRVDTIKSEGETAFVDQEGNLHKSRGAAIKANRRIKKERMRSPEFDLGMADIEAGKDIAAMQVAGKSTANPEIARLRETLLKGLMDIYRESIDPTNQMMGSDPEPYRQQIDQLLASVGLGFDAQDSPQTGTMTGSVPPQLAEQGKQLGYSDRQIQETWAKMPEAERAQYK